MIIEDVVKNLRFLIKTKADLLKNPLNVVAIGMEVMNKYTTLSGPEKKTALIHALVIIANGADGIANTEDDVIPKPVMDIIHNLVEGQLVHNMVNLISDVSKGKFDLGQAVQVAKETQEVCGGCFSMALSRKAKK